MIYNAKKLRQSVFSLIIRRNSHMSIYLISFYQFKRSVMSNKDCYNRLLPQSVRKESAIRYVLNVHSYTSLQMTSKSCNITNNESLDHPSQTAVDIFYFLGKKAQ